MRAQGKPVGVLNADHIKFSNRLGVKIKTTKT
jgi:hypothetical protein